MSGKGNCVVGEESRCWEKLLMPEAVHPKVNPDDKIHVVDI